MGEHIVAKLLRTAQAPAMADHQPAMRAQHRQMIGDRLGVRWSDTDIDQRHAELVFTHKMIGRHLRQRTRRSEEHTSELQSLMRISYAVFCLKKKHNQRN